MDKISVRTDLSSPGEENAAPGGGDAVSIGSSDGPPAKRSRHWYSESEDDGDSSGHDGNDSDSDNSSIVFEASPVSAQAVDKSNVKNGLIEDERDSICTTVELSDEDGESMIQKELCLAPSDAPDALRELVTLIQEDVNNNGQSKHVKDDEAMSILDEVTTKHPKERLYAFCGAEKAFLDRRNEESCNSHSSSDDDDGDFFGLGDEVKKAVFQSFQIKQLHDWQTNMLQRHIQDGTGKKNALILAPTSGGKTLVAVILMLRTMIIDKLDCIFAVPYVAIAAEKVHELQQLANSLPIFTVVEYAGSKGHFPIPKRKSTLRTVYLCTPEKGNGIWKSLCADGERMNEVGMVVVDECHMIRDGQRGAVVEELFVGIMWWSHPSLTILALSATVGNPDALGHFLGGGSPEACNVYVISRRPRQLCETIIASGRAIPVTRSEGGLGQVDFRNKGNYVLCEDKDKRILESEEIQDDGDRVIAKLVLESLSRGDSVLVFCMTRHSCVTTCSMLTKAIRSLSSDADCGEKDEFAEEVKHQRGLVIGHLQNERKGSKNNTLLEGIAVGTAFHSGELDQTERLAVEGAFKRNIVSSLCCTSTLAAGVNLPASRVIIRSPRIGKDFVTGAQYLQMIGRAGRTGFSVDNHHDPADEAGSSADSFILVHPNDMSRFMAVVERPIEPVTSQLLHVSSHYQRSRSSDGKQQNEFSGITRILLNVLTCSNVPLTISQLTAVYQLTLLYQSGVKIDVGGTETTEYTLVPYLKELQELLRRGHILLTSSTATTFKLVVRSSVPAVSARVRDPSQQVDSSPSGPPSEPSQDERESFMSALGRAVNEDSITISDYPLSASAIAKGASAGSLSIADAEKFVMEAELMETTMPLQNTLAFHYLSITAAISKPLIGDAQYQEQMNARNTRLIDRVLSRGFEAHPDAAIMKTLGMNGARLEEWVVGNPTWRNSVTFNETLTRLWSALFVKEWLSRPDDFDNICNQFGFDRTTAMELSANLASRCQNLKILCLSLSRFWWYPPLSNLMIRSLGQACDDSVRPLLVLRHVTIERAKGLLNLGLHNVVDVACVYPPTVLSDNIPFMSKWMAVEIILHARMLVANEAALFEAESNERRKLLRT